MRLDLDLADAATYRNGTPHQLFERLRQNEPVYWNPRPDGPGIWCITKHADINAIGMDTARFTSTRGVSIIRTPDDSAAMQQNLLIFMDPPRHTKMRALVMGAFTPGRMARLEPFIRYQAARAIDRVIAQGGCDFYEVAATLPISMISTLLGVPEEMEPKVLEWTNRTFGHEDPDSGLGPEDMAKAYQEMFGYAFEMAQARRTTPRDDLMSALTHAEIDGAPLTDLEFGYLFFLLLGAGNDTTRALILNLLKLLLENPDAMLALKEDRSLIPGAVEEALRVESSVRGMGRGVVEDVQLRDVTLRAGDQVYLWYVSGNRDEEMFDDPNVFDVRRSNARRHQSFGGGGPHHCSGAALARLQTRILMEELLDRMPDIALAGPPVYARSIQFNSLKRLPLTYPPGPLRHLARPKAD